MEKQNQNKKSKIQDFLDSKQEKPTGGTRKQQGLNDALGISERLENIEKANKN
jgi:hypothetical protein